MLYAFIAWAYGSVHSFFSLLEEDNFMGGMSLSGLYLPCDDSCFAVMSG